MWRFAFRVQNASNNIHYKGVKTNVINPNIFGVAGQSHQYSDRISGFNQIKLCHNKNKNLILDIYSRSIECRNY